MNPEIFYSLYLFESENGVTKFHSNVTFVLNMVLLYFSLIKKLHSMKNEIERKFLVVNNSYRQMAKGILIQQGFLSTDKNRTVRVRIVGGEAWLTVKGKSTGAVRKEFEFQIPADEAKEMIQTICIKPVISKIRYRIRKGEVLWEIDEFLEENAGLIIAEVEIPFENYELEFPDWIGEEVTQNEKYYNARLVEHPYKSW